ncbi:hypothetical protein IRZ71_11415 [Flavobacterium sp. ANB]|uniref:hypothetical protein n=1 Tax=unclassified Flavobacterium TaxID=196869 RepID=UPI0012B9B701|nr:MULTISPECIES: hypothetical protein [unclassified Flavobacterium]MBF4516960.1 hypothetical protein [Flavobacterium sp. ANB]MTD69144.1 hypothetical protein [Flavobacterium sp. LC2016-13]
MKKIILSIIALAAISITSCSSDDQTADSQALAKEQQISSATKKSALVLCSSTSTSVTVNRWQAPSSVDANWTPVAATIGGVNVQWEGIYGGSIRPAGNTDQWYVGTIDLDQTCADYDLWSGTIAVKNDTGNVGTAPASDPYNVLGYDGSISGSNYGLGYYSYNITTHVMTPAKAIVIWKTSGTNSQSITDPTTATEAYLVKVTGIAPGASSSTISYNWTQVK